MFAPQASTECRLVVKASGTAPLATRSYDVAGHEGTMYYFNRRVRCANHSAVGPTVTTTPQYTDGCHDCTAMLRLLTQYLEKHPDNAVATDLPTLVTAVFEGVHGIKPRMLGSYKDVRRGLAMKGRKPKHPFNAPKRRTTFES